MQVLCGCETIDRRICSTLHVNLIVWEGEGELIDFLKETPIPLNVYGKWQALNYSLQVDQILRKQLQDEAKQRLNDWVERNKGSKDGNDAKKLLDKL